MNLELSLDLVHSQGLGSAQAGVQFGVRVPFKIRTSADVGAQPELGFSCSWGSVLQSISSCSSTSLPKLPTDPWLGCSRK